MSNKIVNTLKKQWNIKDEYLSQDNDLLKAIGKKDTRSIENNLLDQFIFYIHEVKKDKSKAPEIDNYFTAISSLICEYGIEDKISEEVNNILIEFQLLHDLGKEWAPEINDIELKILNIDRDKIKKSRTD